MTADHPRTEYSHPGARHQIQAHGDVGMRLTVLLLSIVAFAGCSQGSPGSSATGGADPIRVVVHPFLSYAPLMVAREEGFFEDEGLDVEFIEMTSTVNLVPMLIQGDIDVLPEPISPGILNAIIRGARIRMVSGKGVWDPEACSFTMILAHRQLFEGGDNDTNGAPQYLWIASG